MANSSAPTPPLPAIEIADLVWRPADAAQPTLDLRGERISVPPGGLLLVTGASGAGKSTLLRAIAGLLGTLIPGELEGELTVGGIDLVAAARATAAGTKESGVPRAHLQRLGYLPAGPAPSWALPLVVDDAAIPLESRRHEVAAMRTQIERTAASVGLHAALLQRAHGSLSGGERTQAAAIAALVAGPSLVIADEPFLGLDDVAARAMRTAIIGSNTTRVIAGHDVREHDYNRDRSLQKPSDSVEQLRQLRTGAGKVQVLHLRDIEHVAERRAGSGVDTAPRFAHESASESAVSSGVDDESIVSLEGATGDRRTSPATIALYRGDAVVVSGVTGSGKSTLLALAAGTLSPTHGRRSAAASLRIRLVPQDPGLLLGARPARAQIRRAQGVRAEQVARALDVAHLLDVPSGRCSDGERRRLAIVVALAAEPDLLVADEPTGGLDDRRADAVIGLLDAAHAAGTTLLVATHDPRLHLAGERRMHLDVLSTASSPVGNADAAARLLVPTQSQRAARTANPLTRAAVALIWLLASFVAPASIQGQAAIALPALGVSLLFGVRIAAALRSGAALAAPVAGIAIANLLGGAAPGAALGAAARLLALGCGSLLFLRPFEPLRLADAAIEQLRAPFAATMALLGTAAMIPSMLDEARERRAIRRLAHVGADPTLVVDSFDAIARLVPGLAVALEVRGVRLPTRTTPPTRLRPSHFGGIDVALAVALMVALAASATILS